MHRQPRARLFPNHAPRWGREARRSGEVGPCTGSDLRFLVVGATGFEPVTSSVSAKSTEPLCEARFPRSRSTVGPEVKSSVRAPALILDLTCSLPSPHSTKTSPLVSAATAGDTPRGSLLPPAHPMRRKAGRLVLRSPRCMCSRATTVGQHLAVSVRLPAAMPAYPSSRRRMEGAALGRIARTVNRVGREAQDEPRLLTDDFHRRASGSPTSSR